MGKLRSKRASSLGSQNRSGAVREPKAGALHHTAEGVLSGKPWRVRDTRQLVEHWTVHNVKVRLFISICAWLILRLERLNACLKVAHKKAGDLHPEFQPCGLSSSPYYPGAWNLCHFGGGREGIFPAAGQAPPCVPPPFGGICKQAQAGMPDPLPAFSPGLQTHLSSHS